MYDFQKAHQVHSGKIKGFFRKHEKKYREFVNSQPKDVLCKLWCELNRYQWNDKILGPFKGDLAARTLMAVIDDKVGHYEILRYANVVYDNRMTAEEFLRWSVVQCFDRMEREHNPLYYKD